MKHNWRDDAECKPYGDPEQFFPIGKESRDAQLQVEEAKYFCQQCDVRDDCLNYALENGIEHGVWGGLSEDERRALKRRNGRMGKVATR